MFCVGTGAVGAFQAFAQYYRLAAADSVPSAARGQAISMVLTGGVIAAVIGPALAAWSKSLFPTALFAGSYLVVSVLGLISALLLLAVYRDVDRLAAGTDDRDVLPPRPLTVVMSQPVFVASLANGAVGSVAMMLIMTAAPFAAIDCHHGLDASASIIQWHLVGMFAPSFVAGRLVKRYGIAAVAYSGILLNILMPSSPPAPGACRHFTPRYSS